jgi:hypothetical protein
MINISFEFLKAVIVVVSLCCFRVDTDISEERASPSSCLKCGSVTSEFACDATRCHTQTERSVEHETVHMDQ